MTTGSLPLVFGTDEQFRALRAVLAALHYDEASICARLGIQSIFDFRDKPANRNTDIELNDALDAMIHLLMHGDMIQIDHLRSLAPAAWLTVLELMGVLAKVPNQEEMIYATVFLYPLASLYIASDRGTAIDKSDSTLEREVVYPAISASSRHFLDVLPATPCQDLLDLCSGSGIAAFAGAGYAGQVWSCDLGERSVRFAEFNRRLNAIANATCLQGDLYQPVAGHTFDRILAHPPYVPSEQQEVLFRDGGADGEQVLRGIIEGLPRHLRPGGRCYCHSMATDREGETFEQRMRAWLGPDQREFDVILVANSNRTKADFLLHSRQNPKAFDLEPLFTALKVTSVYYGAVVLQRFSEARAPITVRTRKASAAGWKAVEWYVRWMTASAAPDFDNQLREARPRVSPNLEMNITHVVQNGALVPSQCKLSSDFPFDVALSGGWLAVLVNACDGQKTSAGLLEELKQREVIPEETPEAQFLRDLRTLISCGFLEIEEFPLPRKL